MGQSDDSVSAPGPIFTKGTVNNTPNPLGISGPLIGMVIDDNHRLYIADSVNNRVLVYNLDSSNIPLDRIPDYVIGQQNFYTNALGNTQSGLNEPVGLAYDSEHDRLFVSQDTGNRVAVYEIGSGIATGMNATYVIGQSAFTTATAGNTMNGLNSPNGIYYDEGDDRLFVASLVNRVTVYSFAPGISDGQYAYDMIGQYDDSLTAPQPIFTSGTAQNGPNIHGLSAPINGLSMDTTRHRLFVSDTSNNRVLVYNLDSSNIPVDRIPDYVLGQSDFHTSTAGTTQTGLSGPQGLAFDTANNTLFVADTANHRVISYNLASITSGMSASAVLGQTTFTTATQITTQSGLNTPTGVYFDSAGQRLFVAQTVANRVTVYDIAGGMTNGEDATHVLGQSSFTVATAATTQAGMNVPYDLAYDPTNKILFVSQGTGNRVTTYNISSGITDGQPADFVIGQANFTATALGNTQTGLNAPRGISFDDVNDRLFVSQLTGNRVTVYNMPSGPSTQPNANAVIGQSAYTVITAGITQAGVSGANGVLYDDTSKRLYVMQSVANRITAYDLTSGLSNGPNAVDVLGQYDSSLSTPLPIYTKGTANNGPNKLGLSAPVIGISMDKVNHRLFVADTGNNRVLVYNLNGSNTLVDRIPDNVIGQPDFHSNAAASTQAGLNVPVGLAYDSAGNRLFVSQSTGNRVTAYDVSSISDGEAATFVIGQANFTAATAATTQAGMNVPNGMLYDTVRNHLYVTQATGNRVTVYSGATLSNGMNATHVLGQTNFTATAAATTQAGMNVPYDVAYDPTNKILFVSQGTGNRVTTYDLNAITNGENAVNVIGQANFTATALGNTQAGLNAPRGITFDDTHNKLYVSQVTGNRVTVYNVGAGITDGMAASNVIGQSLFTVITAGVTQTGLSGPSGVLVDEANDRLYVLQTTANRVSMYDLTVGISNGKPASNVLGQSSYTVFTAATTQAGMNIPYDVAYDPTNKILFVSQATGNRVTTYNLSSGITDGQNADFVIGQANFTATAAATTQNGLNNPRGITFDDVNNRLFVSQATGNRVSVFDLTGGPSTSPNAVSVLGQASFVTATAAITQAGMSGPTGVLYDHTSKRLYVMQATANRVTSYDLTSGITDGQNAVDVLAQYDDNTVSPGPIFTKGAVNNSPNALGLSGPHGVAVDTVNHRLIVADTSNSRILVYDLNDSNGLIDRIPDYVLGQSNFYTAALATTQAGLNIPTGLSYDAANERLFVADTNNHRVVVYDLEDIATNESAEYVLGQSTFVASTAGTTQSGLSSPRQLLFDPSSGKLFVADSGNNRVVVYDVGGIGSAGSGGGSGGGQDSFFFFGL